MEWKSGYDNGEALGQAGGNRVGPPVLTALKYVRTVTAGLLGDLSDTRCLNAGNTLSAGNAYLRMLGAS